MFRIKSSELPYDGMWLEALPEERVKVKPADCPLVDDRLRVLKAMTGRSREREEVLVSPKPLNL